MKDDCPNIVFIVIDALRARNLSCYGHPNQISPNIDRIAKDGILFQNSYSCANCTDASRTTLFSGMYPTSHGILGHGGRWRGKNFDEVDTKKLKDLGIRFLPEILRAKGYTTLAVDWLGRWHKRGFDHYSGMLSKTKTISFPIKKVDHRLNLLSRKFASLQKSSIIDDATLVTEHGKWLIKKCHRKRFFLFLHYWDVHAPYAPPIKFFKNLNQTGLGRRILTILNSVRAREEREKEKKVRYLASIVYVDHEIGRLIKTLEQSGIYDKTLFILTSDHGESLGEHDIFFDHHGLYDVSIHVPLILKYPLYGENRRLSGFVQHHDIVPTILDILDMDIKNKKFDGKTLLPMLNDKDSEIHNAVYCEEALYQRKRCIRTHEYKYIMAPSKEDAFCSVCKRIHVGVEELYDLKNDPRETKNIVDGQRDVRNELRKNLNNEFL